MTNQKIFKNQREEVIVLALDCAKYEYPNSEGFEVESTTYFEKGDYWYVEIFTDDGMGMGIRCDENTPGEITCKLIDEF